MDCLFILQPPQVCPISVDEGCRNSLNILEVLEYMMILTSVYWLNLTP